MELQATKRDRSGLIWGTVFAVPIFVICFFLTAIATHVIYMFFSSVHNGPPNRLVELSAAGISSFVGVYAGRWMCDKVLKEWSGWPIFLFLISISALNGFAILTGYGEDDWWRNVLSMFQIIVAAVVSWPLVVKRSDL